MISSRGATFLSERVEVLSPGKRITEINWDGSDDPDIGLTKGI
jgi:hypothetical protein